MKSKKDLYLSAYDEHADAIFRFCFFKLSDRDAAKDAVQEIFMKVWDYLENGNNIDNFKSFLYVTASNHVKDQWKKHKAIPLSALESKDEEGPEFDVPDLKEETVSRSELGIAIEKLEELSESDREVMVLRFIEGLSPSEIAEILGIRENAVSVRLNRAIARFKKIMHYDE